MCSLTFREIKPRIRRVELWILNVFVGICRNFSRYQFVILGMIKRITFIVDISVSRLQELSYI